MKIRKKKWYLWSVLVGILLFGCLTASAETTVYAEQPTEDVSDKNGRDESGILTEYYTERLTGLLEEDPVDSVTEDAEVSEHMVLPEQYDARENGGITSVKQQGAWETCWAFAALNSLENDAVRKGLLGADSADLSERHLAYYTYYPVTDILGGIEEDQTIYAPGDMSFLNFGGNVSLAFHRLANWMGASRESAAPYEQSEERLPHDIVSAYENDVIHLQNVYIYSRNDTDYIKQAIMEYGSACISYYASSVFYNEETAAQYCPIRQNTNHAVSLVGWDDSYPKENFLNAPERDGAWLVKNSWTEEWGIEGYFWISYEDMSIGNNVYVLQAESADNYDNNYQYDGTVLDQYVRVGNDSAKVANVFEASACEDGNELLKAVSFYTYTVNTSYSIQIYGGLENSKAPESGIPLLENEVTGFTRPAGYYTVPLEEEINLEEGQKFSVVITLSKDGSPIYFPSESTRNLQSLISSASAQEGQSFLYENGEWTDWGAENNKNFRIKAFTDNVREEQPEPGHDEETEEDFPYIDVPVIPGNWKYEGVLAVYQKHLMGGYQDNTEFRPDENLKRGDFALLLYKMEGEPDVEYTDCFQDIQSLGGKYGRSVVWVYRNGLAEGFQDGNFRADDPITREQLLKMLFLYARMKDYDVSAGTELDEFQDAGQVSKWAIDYVKWAVDNEIIVGRNIYGSCYLAPKETATRAECAVILKRFWDSYE